MFMKLLQATEFFVYAALMTVVMGIFIYLASRYKYVNDVRDQGVPQRRGTLHGLRGSEDETPQKKDSWDIHDVKDPSTSPLLSTV